MTNNTWAPVIAGIATGIIALAGAFGLEWWRQRRRSKDDLAARRRAAYCLLLSRTFMLAREAGNLRTAAHIRSGVSEALDITFRQRQPVEPLEIADRLRRDEEPMIEALTDIWSIGTSESIPSANKLVARAVDVVQVATEPGKARSGVLGFILRQKWLPEQELRLKDAMNVLSQARKEFAEVARREAGLESVELFLQTCARPPES